MGSAGGLAGWMAQCCVLMRQGGSESEKANLALPDTGTYVSSRLKTRVGGRRFDGESGRSCWLLYYLTVLGLLRLVLGHHFSSLLRWSRETLRLRINKPEMRHRSNRKWTKRLKESQGPQYHGYNW